jgi:steroid delta-isomerase-like uncharacterized protein
MYNPFIAAFPDLAITIDGCVAEGDDVVVRWTVTGNNQGSLLHVPATGRKASFSGMTWLRFADGKIIEGWDRWNAHALLALLASGAETANARWVE